MNLKVTQFISILAFNCFIFPIIAAEKPSDSSKQTTLGLYLTAVEAHKMLVDKADSILFIDVRTRAEVSLLGMAKGVDANIPYMIVGDWDEWDEKKHNFKLFPNSNFLTYFNDYITEHGYNKNTPIILICRSGNRSSGATNLLAQVGYKQVYSTVDGFEGDEPHDKLGRGDRRTKGWKNADLPWSYHLDEEKMYMEF